MAEVILNNDNFKAEVTRARRFLGNMVWPV